MAVPVLTVVKNDAILQGCPELCDDFVALGFGEFGVDGKGHGFVGGSFGLGEVADAVVEVGETGLHVEGEGIVNFAADAGF